MRRLHRIEEHIKSRHGRVTRLQPSIFDQLNVKHLSVKFQKKAQALIRNCKRRLRAKPAGKELSSDDLGVKTHACMRNLLQRPDPCSVRLTLMRMGGHSMIPNAKNARSNETQQLCVSRGMSGPFRKTQPSVSLLFLRLSVRQPSWHGETSRGSSCMISGEHNRNAVVSHREPLTIIRMGILVPNRRNHVSQLPQRSSPASRLKENPHIRSNMNLLL